MGWKAVAEQGGGGCTFTGEAISLANVFLLHQYGGSLMESTNSLNVLNKS